MKKIIALVLTLALLFSLLTACAQKSDATDDPIQGAPEKGSEMTGDVVLGEDVNDNAVKVESGYCGDLLTVGIKNDGGSFAPYGSQSGFGISTGLFQGLVQQGNRGKIHLIMLKSLEKVDDLTYKCELWPFITDTVGNNFKASDVAWSYEQYVAAGNAGGVSCYESIEVTGDYTFIFHCSKPFGVGELGSNFLNPTMVCRASFEATGNDMMASQPSGTGPYNLVEYVQGSSVLVEAKEDFWMKNITDEAWLAENDYVNNYQNWKQIRMEIIPDPSALAIALETGAVDAVVELNSVDINTYRNDPSYGITTINLRVDPPVAFMYNCSEKSPCADKNMRMAIAYAVDNAAMADALSVPAYPVYGVVPNSYDAPENWLTGRDYYDYNMDKAKECLQAAGYNGEPITLMYTDSEVFSSAAIILQSMLGKAGINLELYCVEQSVYQIDRYEYDKWDIRFDTFGGGNWVNGTLRWFYSGNYKDYLEGGKNQMGVVDETLDGLYETLRVDNAEENIVAWDEWFTYEKLYAYGICGYYSMTACKDTLQGAVSIGGRPQLVPQAFSLAEG